MLNYGSNLIETKMLLVFFLIIFFINYLISKEYNAIHMESIGLTYPLYNIISLRFQKGGKKAFEVVMFEQKTLIFRGENRAEQVAPRELFLSDRTRWILLTL